MSGNVRCSDLWVGMCYCRTSPHDDEIVPMSGPVITCSTDVIIDHSGQARVGDVVIGFCGHLGLIVVSSSDVNCNNRGAARLGDVVVGCMIGTLATSSSDVGSN